MTTTPATTATASAVAATRALKKRKPDALRQALQPGRSAEAAE